jgi:hypothetical protein
MNNKGRRSLRDLLNNGAQIFAHITILRYGPQIFYRRNKEAGRVGDGF